MLRFEKLLLLIKSILKRWELALLLEYVIRRFNEVHICLASVMVLLAEVGIHPVITRIKTFGVMTHGWKNVLAEEVLVMDRLSILEHLLLRLPLVAFAQHLLHSLLFLNLLLFKASHIDHLCECCFLHLFKRCQVIFFEQLVPILILFFRYEIVIASLCQLRDDAVPLGVVRKRANRCTILPDSLRTLRLVPCHRLGLTALSLLIRRLLLLLCFCLSNYLRNPRTLPHRHQLQFLFIRPIFVIIVSRFVLRRVLLLKLRLLLSLVASSLILLLVLFRWL